MPKGITTKVITRQRIVLKFIENEICATTKQIIQEFGLTYSQAFHVLQSLKKNGLLEEYVVGNVSLWCISGHVTNDVHLTCMSVYAYELERAICRILEGARGHKTTIRPSRVVDEIAEGVRTPQLLTYVSDMLSIMLSNVEKMVLSDSRGIEYYVVDTCSICNFFGECPTCETLRKKLNC
jgi:hypothetical protein